MLSLKDHQLDVISSCHQVRPTGYIKQFLFETISHPTICGLESLNKALAAFQSRKFLIRFDFWINYRCSINLRTSPQASHKFRMFLCAKQCSSVWFVSVTFDCVVWFCALCVALLLGQQRKRIKWKLIKSSKNFEEAKRFKMESSQSLSILRDNGQERKDKSLMSYWG